VTEATAATRTAVALERIAAALKALSGPEASVHGAEALEAIAASLERATNPLMVVNRAGSVRRMSGCPGCGQPYTWPHLPPCAMAAAEA
jgi:hypothetical protein